MPGSVKALRLHNLILGGGLTAAQLETELNNARAAGAFDASLKQRTVVTALNASAGGLNIVAGSAKAVSAILRQDTTVLAALCADSTAAATMVLNTLGTIAPNAAGMAIVTASSTAMTAVAASATAMGIVAASATAMASVAASSVAITACMGNTVARSAIYNNDTALSALANATTVGYLRAVSQYATKTISNNSAVTAVSLGFTGSAILVDIALDNSGTITFANRRAGSAVGTLGPVDPAATALPGDTDIMALQSTATVATSSSAARTTAIGYIYV